MWIVQTLFNAHNTLTKIVQTSRHQVKWINVLLLADRFYQHLLCCTNSSCGVVRVFFTLLHSKSYIPNPMTSLCFRLLNFSLSYLAKQKLTLNMHSQPSNLLILLVNFSFRDWRKKEITEEISMPLTCIELYYLGTFVCTKTLMVKLLDVHRKTAFDSFWTLRCEMLKLITAVITGLGLESNRCPLVILRPACISPHRIIRCSAQPQEELLVFTRWLHGRISH